MARRKGGTGTSQLASDALNIIRQVADLSDDDLKTVKTIIKGGLRKRLTFDRERKILNSASRIIDVNSNLINNQIKNLNRRNTTPDITTPETSADDIVTPSLAVQIIKPKTDSE